MRDLLLYQTMAGTGAQGPLVLSAHLSPNQSSSLTPQACPGGALCICCCWTCVVPVSPFLQPATVPLKSSPALWHIDCFRLCIIHKLDSKRSCPRATLQLLVHRAEHLWQVSFGLFPAVFSLCLQV